MIRTLVTNDDGISSPYIKMLAEEFLKLGEVVIIAPDSQRSACSHAISLHAPISISSTDDKEGYLQVAMSGTPADCVKFGIQEYGDFDLIVSGINTGPNLGYHVLYSGTVAAALEGAMYSIPSFAFSMEDSGGNGDYSFAADFARKIVENLLKKELGDNIAFNVNFPGLPGKEIKGIRITRQGDFRFNDVFEKRNGSYFLFGSAPVHNPGKDTDLGAIRSGYISVTPLKADLTNHDFCQSLEPFEI